MDEDLLRFADSREIEKLPQPPFLYPILVDALTDLCFAPDTTAPADVIFVLGSNILHSEVAGIITRLIHRKISENVVISGGIANYKDSFYHSEPESELIYSNIPVGELPGVNFYRETKSRNMLENVIESRRVYDFTPERSILFLSHAYASTRCRLTLQRNLPYSHMFSLSYPTPSGSTIHPVCKDHWWKTDYGQAIVWGEYLRILQYGSKGDLDMGPVKDQLSFIAGMIDNA